MDIFEELHSEHEQVSELIQSLQSSGPDAATLTNLKSELTAHSEAEEQVFYKRIEDEDETKDVVADGYEEHKEIARKLGVLTPDLGADTFSTALKELKESVDHHVAEEEWTLFEKTRPLLSEGEAESLCRAFEKAKSELQA
jgi:hemerythrin superfamily protein